MQSTSVIQHFETAICIPARNESGRIGACLDAISAQCDPRGQPLDLTYVTIFVLVNNCTDNTSELLQVWRQSHPLNVRQRDVVLPIKQAHAGGARRSVMDWAASSLNGRQALICSTDADSRVSPTWLHDLWSAFATGVDAVAGVVEFDPLEAASGHLPSTRRLEDRYAALQAEVAACLDPEPHNPWPNHLWAWGANFAVTSGAYRAVGGLPPHPLAEDRAFAAALRRRDLKVRHAPNVKVVTSCREQGRAPGGLADLIHAYRTDPQYPCDAELEPILIAATRARLRRTLRSLGSDARRTAAMADDFQLDPAILQRALKSPYFGERWAMIERVSPRLARHRLLPHALPLEIARAESLLDHLNPARAEDPGDSDRLAPAGLWSACALSAG